jgi:hypothetical protein
MEAVNHCTLIDVPAKLRSAALDVNCTLVPRAPAQDSRALLQRLLDPTCLQKDVAEPIPSLDTGVSVGQICSRPEFRRTQQQHTFEPQHNTHINELIRLGHRVTRVHYGLVWDCVHSPFQMARYTQPRLPALTLTKAGSSLIAALQWSSASLNA